MSIYIQFLVTLLAEEYFLGVYKARGPETHTVPLGTMILTGETNIKQDVSIAMGLTATKKIHREQIMGWTLSAGVRGRRREPHPT